MTDEDRILIDLFRHRHQRGAPRAKQLLVEHREHRALIDRLCEQGDVLALGDSLFHITLQGQRRITAKYPDLWEARGARNWHETSPDSCRTSPESWCILVVKPS